jgi:uncharacterized glyoxalase superfamily protein PhnB
VAANKLRFNLETDSLFHALAEGGSVHSPPQPMFRGARFDRLRERFGVQWTSDRASGH